MIGETVFVAGDALSFTHVIGPNLEVLPLDAVGEGVTTEPVPVSICVTVRGEPICSCKSLFLEWEIHEP